MKKALIFIGIIAVIIIAVVIYQQNGYNAKILEIKELNEEYESFTNGNILGTSLITLINKTVDLNKKNNIQLDENKLFIENDTNSIKINIKFLDSQTTFPMEKIENMGSEEFTKNYASASFKCIKKEYHNKTKNIKYLLFEEVQ